MSASRNIREQREQCAQLHDNDVGEYVWNLWKSPLGATDTRSFLMWRLICVLDTKLKWNMQLTDFDFALQTQHFQQQLQHAILNVVPNTSNWLLTQIFLFRSSWLNECLLNCLELSEACMQHIVTILLASFQTMTDDSQLGLLFRLLESVSKSQQIFICSQLSLMDGASYVAQICAPLLLVIESPTMCDAVLHINRVIAQIGNDTHNFSLTIITAYPFATFNNNHINDPKCIVRLPFRGSVQVQQPLNITSSTVVGIHDNNCSVGRYQSRPFILAFDTVTGVLRWGQEITNTGMNALIVNEYAVACVPVASNMCMDVCVYDIMTGKKTATLIKPDRHARLSVKMDTWTIQNKNEIICFDTITGCVKFHNDETHWKCVTAFAFGVLLEDFHKTLHVGFFSDNALEVKNCICYSTHANLLVVVSGVQDFVMTVYELRENGAHFQHKQVLNMAAVTLQHAKILTCNACGLILQHNHGFLFLSFNKTQATNVPFCVQSWAHVLAGFDTVWIWNRNTKQLTTVTQKEVTHVARVDHMFGIVHVDHNRIFVL